jgi:hypothetical protein
MPASTGSLCRLIHRGTPCHEPGTVGTDDPTIWRCWLWFDDPTIWRCWLWFDDGTIWCAEMKSDVTTRPAPDLHSLVANFQRYHGTPDSPWMRVTTPLPTDH